MNANVKTILSASGGAFVGGVVMKKFKQPLVSVGVLGLGIMIAIKGKTEIQRAAGLGMASVGAIGTVGKIAEKVTALQNFAPQINGMGDLYQDENGNIIEMGGLNGQELVQDEFGNTYMVNGLNGEEMDTDLLGLYGDEDEDEYELEGLYGDDLSQLV